MDIKKLKDFIKFMDENNLSELEIEADKERIRLKKYEGQIAQPMHQPVVAANSSEAEKPQETKLKEIKSPMVGTFYRAASPGSQPYVEAGQSVKKGDVICIIEAMKVMNEIKAETNGQIDQILVENGQPVEFGQALFTLR